MAMRSMLTTPAPNSMPIPTGAAFGPKLCFVWRSHSPPASAWISCSAERERLRLNTEPNCVDWPKLPPACSLGTWSIARTVPQRRSRVNSETVSCERSRSAPAVAAISESITISPAPVIASACSTRSICASSISDPSTRR